MGWLNNILSTLWAALRTAWAMPPEPTPAPAPDPQPAPDPEPPEPPDAPRLDEKRTLSCRPSRGEYLIDAAEGDGRCGKCVVRGDWQSAPYRACLGGAFLYLDKSAKAGARVTFIPKLLVSGRYEVWVGYVCSHAGARAARLTLRHEGGEETIRLSQYEESRGYRWRWLGEWRFGKGAAARIILHGDTGPLSASERIDCVGLRLVR